MMRSFGTLEDGRSVEAITLGEPQGLQVEVLTYGAILRRLTLSGARCSAAISFSHFDRLEDYVRDRAYVGALVGRFGNRIASAQFSLDGREHARHGQRRRAITCTAARWASASGCGACSSARRRARASCWH